MIDGTQYMSGSIVGVKVELWRKYFSPYKTRVSYPLKPILRTWILPQSRYTLTTWALLKSGKQSIGCSKDGLTTKIHLLATSARSVLAFRLFAGNAHDASKG